MSELKRDRANSMSFFKAVDGCKPVIIVMCGPSHSGKSTIARQLMDIGKSFKVVSSDIIREQLLISFQYGKDEDKVLSAYESMKHRLLMTGSNIILDACCITERARWSALQGYSGNHKKICIVFDLPWQTIKARYSEEKLVSFEEVRRMWSEFQRGKPGTEELKRLGFDVVCFIRDTEDVIRAIGTIKRSFEAVGGGYKIPTR